MRATPKYRQSDKDDRSEKLIEYIVLDTKSAYQISARSDHVKRVNLALQDLLDRQNDRQTDKDDRSKNLKKYISIVNQSTYPISTRFDPGKLVHFTLQKLRATSTDREQMRSI